MICLSLNVPGSDSSALQIKYIGLPLFRSTNDHFNPQEQPKQTWPASAVVARAYLDQLNRDKALPPARAAAIKTAIDHAEKSKTPAMATELATAADELSSDAASATGRDAQRMRALAETLKGIK